MTSLTQAQINQALDNPLADQTINDLPGQAPPSTPNPGQDGYVLLRFANGAAAIVQSYADGSLNWGNVTPPSSSIVGSYWLGTDAENFTQSRIAYALQGLSTSVKTGITNVLGDWQSGTQGTSLGLGFGLSPGDNTVAALLWGPAGKLTNGSQADVTAGSAASSNQGISLPSIDLGGDAIRVLEAVGGVLLLVIALRAFLGGPDPTQLVARAVG